MKSGHGKAREEAFATMCLISDRKRHGRDHDFIPGASRVQSLRLFAESVRGMLSGRLQEDFDIPGSFARALRKNNDYTAPGGSVVWMTQDRSDFDFQAQAFMV